MEFVFVATVLSSFIISSQGCPACDATPLPLTRLANKCYYFEMTKKKNWHSADLFCNSHGMRLASIQNEEENTALGNHIDTLELTDERSFWTSGSDLSSEGSWFWSALGRRITYQNWWDLQPDNTANLEHCLNVNTVNGILRWNDMACRSEIFIICEINPLMADIGQLC